MSECDISMCILLGGGGGMLCCEGGKGGCFFGAELNDFRDAFGGSNVMGKYWSIGLLLFH